MIKIDRVPDKVAEKILNLISEGKLKTGDTLPSERKLAEMFEVSRASIREALKYLELAGFIKTSPGKRTIIKNATEEIIQNPLEILFAKDEKKIIDLTKVRVFLESYGARDAAIHRTDDDVKKLTKIISCMEYDFKNNILNFSTDFDFHTTIATSTKNLIYIHIVETVHNLIRTSLKFYREVFFTSKKSQENLLNQHKAIFEAIKNKNPEIAEKNMRKHLEYVIDEYNKINKENNEL